MFGIRNSTVADILECSAGLGVLGGVPGMIIWGGFTGAAAEYLREGELDGSVLAAGLTGAALGAIGGGVPSLLAKRTAGSAVVESIRSPRDLWTAAGRMGSRIWDRNNPSSPNPVRPWRFGNARRLLWSTGRPLNGFVGATLAGVGNNWMHGGFTGGRPDELPVIPVFPTKPKPSEMDEIFKPDMSHRDYPEEFYFGTVADGLCDSLPDRFVDYFLSLGTPPASAPDTPPTLPTVQIGALLPDDINPAHPEVNGFIDGFPKTAIQEYRVLAKRLKDAAKALHDKDLAMVNDMRHQPEDLEACRLGLNRAIAIILEDASAYPPSGQTKDQQIFDYIARAVSDATQTIEHTMTLIDQRVARFPQPAPGGTSPAPPGVPPIVQPPGDENPQNPRDVEPVTRPEFQPEPVPGLGLDGSDSPGDSGSGSLADLLRTAGNPGGVPSVSPAGLNPLGAGGIPGLNGIPGLLNQMRPTDPNSLGSPERRVPDVRGSREMAPPPAVPSLTPKPGAVTAAQTTPAPAAAATATGTGTSPAPATPSAATTTGTPPARLPDSGGGVWYDFPPVGSGIRQYVTPLVAKALDAAFGNTDGTNAQRAYQDTPAKWSNSKEMDPVGPDEAITGCVVKFERPTEGSSDSGKPQPSQPGRSGQPGKGAPEQTPLATTAVLVVFRMAENNTEGVTADSFEVIVDGQRVQYTDQLSGKAGAFGDFAGFGRPRGVAPVASAPGDAMPAQPHPSDTGSVDALIAAGTVST
ncbi:hypothetical protein ACWIGW_39250 [Nocardia brasiliensis]